MKRIFLIVLAVMMLCVSVIFPVSAEGRESTLMQELESATVNGKAFNFADYPKKAGAEAQLLSFMEIGYSYTGDQSKYGLYVYIYNPSEKVIVESGKNKITLATKYDAAGMSKASDYEQFDLQYVDKTSNNRFYKFLVIDHVSAHDGNKIVQRVDRAARKYTMSKIDIQHVGNANATPINVSQEYVFTGYQSDGNLSVKGENITMLELDVTSTYWRSKTSSLGVGHQNQITSVYFSVPNKMIQDYGTLNAIKASWDERKTTPIIVTTDSIVENAVKPWLGVNIGVHRDDVLFTLSTMRIQSGVQGSYAWSYNVKQTAVTQSDVVCPMLGYLFRVDEIDSEKVNVTSEEMLRYIREQNYADWLFADKVDEGRTKGYQEKTIEADKLFDLKSFGSSMSWYEKFYSKLFYGNVDLFHDYENIAPIVEVKFSDLSSKSDAQISETYFIAEKDVSDFRKAVADAEKRNETMWIFRFAVTDYYTRNIGYVADGYRTNDDIYMAEQTVFLDFNVIWLKLGEAIIPIVMSPIDIVGDVTAPYNPPLMDWSFFKVIVEIIAIIVLVLVLMSFFPWVADAVGGLFGNAVEDARTSIRRMKKNKGGKK